MSLNAEQAQKLIARLPSLKNQKVMIVGDIGLDEYTLGEVKRISPEAPVPVVEVTTEDRRLGLAANVAQNISSLAGVPYLFSVVGDDSTAHVLSELLEKVQIKKDHLITDSSRPTTRKLRVMAQHHHIVRVDFEHRRYLDKHIEDQLLQKVKERLSEVQAVILQDYAKGVLSERVCQEVIRMARGLNKKIVVDPNPKTPVHYYRGAHLMTPNHDESLALAGVVMDDLRADKDYLDKIGKKLMTEIDSETMVLTLGKNGMLLFENGQKYLMPTFARQVFDVTGAGDTVIAVLTLAWASGWTLSEACQLANFAAGVVVGKVGCVPCSPQELVDYMQEHFS